MLRASIYAFHAVSLALPRRSDVIRKRARDGKNIQYHITWRVAALFKRTKNSLRSFHYFDLRESWKRICFVYRVAKEDRLSVELLWGLCVIEDGVGRRLQRVWQMCLPSDLVETSLELVICFHNVCCEGDKRHRNMYVWHEVPLLAECSCDFSVFGLEI